MIDTDKWGDKIDELRNAARERGYSIAQSNPCFEVWLYYHFYHNKPDFDGKAGSKAWKNFVNQAVPGGFDSSKHPIYLGDANRNAAYTYETNDLGAPALATTQLFELGERLHGLLKHKLETARHKLPPLPH